MLNAKRVLCSLNFRIYFLSNVMINIVCYIELLKLSTFGLGHLAKCSSQFLILPLFMQQHGARCDYRQSATFFNTHISSGFPSPLARNIAAKRSQVAPTGFQTVDFSIEKQSSSHRTTAVLNKIAYFIFPIYCMCSIFIE